MEKINVGIIGGGLMGKEAASAFGRWFTLNDYPFYPQLSAVCDLNENTLSWYDKIPSVVLKTTDYAELLADESIDVVYVAVPHSLHREIYIAVLESGKDLLAEKPFGINLEHALEIKQKAESLGRFVRCSSEIPFMPGAQRAIREIQSGRLGKIIEVKAGFLHSSDMDPGKPINWKRQAKYCGEIGVMADLGMHVLHIPLRLGWKPSAVFGQLQKIVHERPNGKGEMVPCDTWNNATLSCKLAIDEEPVPMTLEMKRLAPGETNTWYIEVLGTEGGIRYSTKDTKAFWTFSRAKEQAWQRVDLGFQTQLPVTTGGIFEAGFADCFLQMLASYIIERGGKLNDKFGCVKPEEAVDSHRIFEAALQSHLTQSVVEVSYTDIPVTTV